MLNNKKKFMACLVNCAKLDSFLLTFQKIYYSNNFIRAINYHGTPFKDYANLEQQLQLFYKYYSDVNLIDLDNFFLTKRWPKTKPGIIISFDDGLRSNYHVAAALLEKYGFTGWFFVATDFISCHLDKQKDFAEIHNINYCNYKAETTNLAMSWDNVIDLDRRGHVICSHTKTHYRIEKNAPQDKIDDEIIHSKIILEDKLLHKVETFGWVGGEEIYYNRNAAKCIKKAGYKYSFMVNAGLIRPTTNRLQLQRINIEAWWPCYIVYFQLSGIMDLLYIPKRYRVNKLTLV